MSNKSLQIQKVKGRALLYWVGKKPIDAIESYPAQLIETMGAAKALEIPAYEALEDNWSNLLFHGDNKEILNTLLVNGFRGKVDLIYIDPPFDSGADYIRKVELRGTKEKVTGEEQTTLEQVQYEDIWANDNYLQFMYERLILLRELLSEKGSIYLHCDWHKNHHLRMLLDEVFGQDNFVNEITWNYTGPGYWERNFVRKHDTIYLYSKNKQEYTFNPQFTQYKSGIHVNKEGDVLTYGGGTKESNAKEIEERGKPLEDWWTDVYTVDRVRKELLGYPTQKPEQLLERIIAASTNPDSLVLDCFLGSGTTAAVAQKLGRRWIGADINKGAIQTTMKRLDSITAEQHEKPPILHYRVNNYDFQQMSALRAIIIEKYGVEESKTDIYFDGTMGQRLVKIAELNKPVTKLDIQSIMDELKNRPNEDRDILLIGSGIEMGVHSMLANHQQLNNAPNHIEVKNIQTDGIIVAEPAESDVTVKKTGGKVTVKIENYLSPTIIKRLAIDRSVFGERIKDFRAQIDTIFIDTNYNDTVFNATFSDVPERKQDLVAGEYELELPSASKKVAVKITDMLGEETLIIR